MKNISLETMKRIPFYLLWVALEFPLIWNCLDWTGSSLVPSIYTMVSMNGESDAPPKIVRWQHQLLHDHLLFFILFWCYFVNAIWISLSLSMIVASSQQDTFKNLYAYFTVNIPNLIVPKPKPTYGMST